MTRFRSYFDTVGIPAAQVVEYEIRASGQEDEVLEFFQHHPDLELTAEQIHGTVLPEAPRTSAGRCLTQLEKKGFIERVGKATSSWGRPCLTYKLKGDPTQPRLL